MFAAGFERLLESHCTPALVRAADADPAAADGLAAQIAGSGFADLLLEESAGGAGLPLAGLAPLVLACGAFLCPVDFPEQAVARRFGTVSADAQAALMAGRIAGAARRLLEMTIAHVTTRQQFGRPLAAFQAVQQQLAVLAEEVAAATLAAEIGFSGPAFETARSAAAKLRANEAAGEAVRIAHQLHGAIGATADYDLQLYSRALMRWQREGGTSGHWAEVLGRHRLADGRASLAYIEAHLATCARDEGEMP
jgi:acyl-CoA dehydrogenase